MPTNLSPEQRRAVGHAWRGVYRRVRGLSREAREDLFQDAAEALLRVKIDESRSSTEQAVYLAQRARGAMFDSLRSDALRGALRGRSAAGFTEAHIEGGDEGERLAEIALVDPSKPENYVGLVQTLRAIAALAPPRPLVALRLIEGVSGLDIAAELGVTQARVSKLRAEICGHIRKVSICDY